MAFTRMRFTSVLLALAVCLLSCAVHAYPAVAEGAEQEPALSEAQGAIVMDAEGNVLYEKAADQRIYMASITKLMTAVVALEQGPSLDTVCQLSTVELPEEAMVAGYKEGMTSTLRDLMRVMLVRSANDAACEVARAVSGSEEAFVASMNAKAKELGLSNTHFVNPHGLDAADHYSSARDLVTLARYALTTQPFIAQTVQLREVTAPVGEYSYTFESTNQLLEGYAGTLGIKTGAGNELTSFLGCNRRGGTTLYACVLGCTTKQGRFDDTVALWDWAWSRYQAHQLSSKGLLMAVEPYAYHFGLSCLVTADASTSGVTWPDGGVATYSSIMRSAGTLCVPGEPVGVCQWTQDGRVVASASYSTRPLLVRARSGFGILEQNAYFRQALVGSA